MTQMVTRCPKCSTAFRITSTQLVSAKGAVRCGSCLHIFKAQDYLVNNPIVEPPIANSPLDTLKPKPATTPATATKTRLSTTKVEAPPANAVAATPKLATRTTEKPLVSAATKPTTPTQAPLSKPRAPTPPNHTVAADKVTTSAKPAAPTQQKPQQKPKAGPVLNKSKVLADGDDLLISDDMDKPVQKKSLYDGDEFLGFDSTPMSTASLFEREIRDDTEEDDQNSVKIDESWAEKLLDSEESQPQIKKAVPATKTVDGKKVDNKQPTEKPKNKDLSQPIDSAYSGPVFSLITDAEAEQEFSDAFLSATRSPNKDEKANDANLVAAALFDIDPNQELDGEKPSTKKPVKSASKNQAFDTSRAALLMNIMPAPVEFTAKRMQRWHHQKLWPGLSLVMGLLLFLQIAYFKFDHFSRIEPYRSAYSIICPSLGCKVPSLIDTSQILVTNLIVRNHPSIGRALMVEAILINNAPFEQPFPDLMLAFSKLDDTPVASRRFTATDYVGGELTGVKHIPSGQPVHIALEIVDPGQDAVNYTLTPM